jgi:hypothetical protein
MHVSLVRLVMLTMKERAQQGTTRTMKVERAVIGLRSELLVVSTKIQGQ